MRSFAVIASAIRDSARKVTRIRQGTDWPAEPDHSLVDLAALLFAIARLLAGRLGDASLEGQTPRAFPSLKDGLEILAALPPKTDRKTLYRYAIQGLQAIEAVLRKPRDRHLLSRPVTLPTVKHEHDALVSGTVQFWFRPRSELSDLRRERREASKKPLPMEPRRYPENHLETLGAYWQANLELPSCQPLNSFDPMLDEHLLVSDIGGLAREESFRVALCPLEGEFHPHFEIREEGTRFCIHQPSPMAAQAALERHLNLLLEAACRQQVDLILLPELTVDSVSLDHIRKQLNTRLAEYPRAIVPGSFHFWEDEEPRPFNGTRLLDSLGAELLSHRKAGRFRITPEHVARAPHFFRCCTHVAGGGVLCDPIYEDIDRTASLQFLDTSLGRLAVAICADGIDHEQNTLYDAVRTLRPDLVLIVSMSFKTRRFEDLAEQLALLGIGTLMVNAACVCDSTAAPAPMLAIADLALPDLPGLPATRIRWRAGNADAEFFDRDRETWDPTKPGSASATDWLAAGEQRLGLILDLSPHFKVKS